MRKRYRYPKRTFVVLRGVCLQGNPKTRYLLLQAKRGCRFYVQAARQGEAPQRAPIGQDGERGAALFALLVAHAVSPCHVASVVLDFCE